MKILYVDPVCYPTHSGFNKMHINALKKQFGNVDLCFEEGYSQYIDYSEEQINYRIPKGIIQLHSGGLKYRLSIRSTLNWIKRNVELNKYDAIILSCYDEIALGLTSFPGSYIINHNNVGNLNSLLKRAFFKFVSRKHKHIVLTKSAGALLTRMGISNWKLVSHGLPVPFFNREKKNNNPADVEFIVFSPSQGSNDRKFLESLINSVAFNDWLKTNKIKLIIRGCYSIPSYKNIDVIRGFISEKEYQNLFLGSDCILISYPLNFKYRVSAVLLEAIANNKKIALRRTDTFEEYIPIVGENSYFDDIESLKWVISFHINNKKKQKYDSSYIKNYFHIDYSFLNEET